MRLSLICLSALILITSSALAQDTPKPSVDAKRLDEILATWEKRTSKIESMTTKVKRTITSSVGKKTVGQWEFAFLKRDMIRAELTPEEPANESPVTLLIIRGTKVDVFGPKNKLIESTELKAEKPDPHQPQWVKRFANAYRTFLVALRDDFYFLKGMKAAEFKNCYEVTSLKETEWYIYLSFKSKENSSDKHLQADAAELVLFKKNPNEPKQPDLTMMPVRVWLQTSATQQTFEFTEMRPNAPLKPESFEPKLAKEDRPEK